MSDFVYKPTPLMLPTSHYDKKKADRVVNFISKLKHTTGKFYNTPFVLMPWQEQIIRDVFGIVDENGFRQFREVFVEIPKKNGKSELAAAVALYLLAFDREPGARVYSCAADKLQAGLVYDVACAMIALSPELQRILKVINSTKIIRFRDSIYQVMSSAIENKYGFNVSGLVFDELIAQKNRKLYDTMTMSTGTARDQQLIFTLTTASSDHNSICYEVHQRAERVLDGSNIDPRFYPVLFGIKEGEDWTDPEVWKRCNPSIGVTLKFSTVEEEFERAKQSMATEVFFRQFRLNEDIDVDIKWLPIDRWDKCAASYTEADLLGRKCYGGLDLSSSGDLTAFALVFPPENPGEKYRILVYFWLPKDIISFRSRRDHVPYEIWERQKNVIVTPGDVVDYDYILHHVTEICKKFDVQEIAFDRAMATWLEQKLNEIAAEYSSKTEIIRFGQGFLSMSPPTKDLYQSVMLGKIEHNNSPVLRWCIGNTIVEMDAAGNIKPSKRKSPEKIDGTVATIMAFSRAVVHEDKNPRSVYDREDRGLLII
jgi:phage terminase large subunit-like protein